MHPLFFHDGQRRPASIETQCVTLMLLSLGRSLWGEHLTCSRLPCCFSRFCGCRPSRSRRPDRTRRRFKRPWPSTTRRPMNGTKSSANGCDRQAPISDDECVSSEPSGIGCAKKHSKSCKGIAAEAMLPIDVRHACPICHRCHNE